MLDFLQIESVLDRIACDELRDELRTAAGSAAQLLGGELLAGVRRATRIGAWQTTAARVRQLFARQRPALERHFGVALGECEEPQFLRYETGDFFVAHQDGNTPLIHDDSRFRIVSAVIFLSEQSGDPGPESYGGGDLVLHGPWPHFDHRLTLAPAPGTLVAFRAETTHEVLPITHGERFTVATWFRRDQS